MEFVRRCRRLRRGQSFGGADAGGAAESSQRQQSGHGRGQQNGGGQCRQNEGVRRRAMVLHVGGSVCGGLPGQSMETTMFPLTASRGNEKIRGYESSHTKHSGSTGPSRVDSRRSCGSAGATPPAGVGHVARAEFPAGGVSGTNRRCDGFGCVRVFSPGLRKNPGLGVEGRKIFP